MTRGYDVNIRTVPVKPGRMKSLPIVENWLTLVNNNSIDLKI